MLECWYDAVLVEMVLQTPVNDSFEYFTKGTQQTNGTVAARSIMWLIRLFNWYDDCVFPGLWKVAVFKAGIDDQSEVEKSLWWQFLYKCIVNTVVTRCFAVLELLANDMNFCGVAQLN